jgi:hypothetical protein
MTKRKVKAMFSPKYVLADPLSFEDLITAIQSNEKDYDEKTVRRVFGELMVTISSDASSMLRKHMKDVLKELEDSRDSSTGDANKWGGEKDFMRWLKKLVHGDKIKMYPFLAVLCNGALSENDFIKRLKKEGFENTKEILDTTMEYSADNYNILVSYEQETGEVTVNWEDKY